MQPGKRGLVIAGWMMASLLLLPMECLGVAEGGRKKAAVAAPAAHALRQEVAKATQLSMLYQLPALKRRERRCDPWNWVIWVGGGLLALLLLVKGWTGGVSPIIQRRQAIRDQVKNAQLYAAKAAVVEEEAEIERAKATQLESRRRIQEAEAKKAEEQRLIEQAKAKQLELPRLIAELEARQAEDERRARDAEARKAEDQRVAGAVEAIRAEEHRLRIQAEARKAEEQRQLKEAEAARVAKQAEIERAKAVQAQRDLETAKAKQAEENRKALQAQAEIEKAKAVLAQRDIEQAKAKQLEKQELAAQAESKTTEEQRLTAVNEAKKADRERRKEEARLSAAELERQNSLKQYPLAVYLDVFYQQAETLERWIENGEEENRVFDLHLKLKAMLQAASKIPLEKRERIPEQHRQLNQVETLIDLYSEKIRRVQNDEDLDDEEREEKIAYWRDLRNRQIGEIQGP